MVHNANAADWLALASLWDWRAKDVCRLGGGLEGERTTALANGGLGNPMQVSRLTLMVQLI